MTELFLTILNMSISASWIVLAVFVLRLLLKKSPKWITVLLWAIVAVRLVCPFSFESVLSLIPSGQTIPTDIAVSPNPNIDSGVPIINDTINPIITQNFTPTVETDVNPLQILLSVITLAWVLGIAAMLIYTAVSYCRVKSRVKTAVLMRDNIYQCETVESPFVLGVIKPKIYLPFDISGQDLDYVIAHEQSHISRKDHIWKPFGFLILSVYWFNPLIWMAYILLCRDIELACDEKVINRLDTQERADYSQALLNCSVNRRVLAACPLTFGEVSVKQRIKGVLKYKKPAFWIVIVAVAAIIASSVCLLTNPKSTKSLNKNQKEHSSVLNNQAESTQFGEDVTRIFWVGNSIENYEQLNQQVTNMYQEIPESRFVDVSSGTEAFVIIPAAGCTKVKVNVLDQADTPTVKEELYTSNKAEPIAVKGNVSDIMSDILVTLTINGKDYQFSPSVALDGSGRVIAEYPFGDYDDEFSVMQYAAAIDGSLLLTLTGTNDTSDIKIFQIIHKYGGVTTDITDKDDLAFLDKYIYSHQYPQNELHKLFTFPETQMIKVETDFADYTTMYLMDDGSIAIQTMNGDSGVSEISYDVYTADNKDILDEKALIKLLKKYGGYTIS